MSAALLARLRWAGLTHAGHARRTNEDALAMIPTRGVFAVFDAIGGAGVGDRAAQGAARGLATDLEAATPAAYGGLAELIRRRSDAMWQDAQSAPERRGQGATAAAAWFDEGGRLEIAHVGDCRVYRWRRDMLDVLTEDHTLLNQLAATQQLSAAELEAFPYNNVIIRSIGLQESLIGAETRVTSWEAGDLYIICTDGMYRDTTHDLIARALWRSDTEDVEHTAQALMGEVLAGAARDNIALVVVMLTPNTGED
jgi:serine/threonine protein phosphatase PrpC